MTWRAPTLPKPTKAQAFEVRDAAVANAIGKCWLARKPGMPLTVRTNHETCGWCAYDLNTLMESLCGFWRSPDVSDECERFDRLAPSVRSRLVMEAAK